MSNAISVNTVHENSLDNSDEREILGMVDEGSYGSGEETEVLTETLVDTKDNINTSFHVEDYSGGVAYKLVSMESTNETTINVTPETHMLPNGDLLVIGNPMDVFGNQSKKASLHRNSRQVKIAVQTKKRDNKRRATHNEVERRRRDKINSWITKLADVVPSNGPPDMASKGCILAKAYDHILELSEKQKRLEKLEVENEKLVLEILRLNQELSELRKDNTTMRNQIADNCMVYAQNRPKGQKS